MIDRYILTLSLFRDYLTKLRQLKHNTMYTQFHNTKAVLYVNDCFIIIHTRHTQTAFFFIHRINTATRKGRGRRARRQRKSIFSLTCRFLTHLGPHTFVGSSSSSSLKHGGGEEGKPEWWWFYTHTHQHTHTFRTSACFFSFLRLFSLYEISGDIYNRT